MLLLVSRASSAEFVLDFEDWPLGPWTEQRVVPDGHGGFFALTPENTDDGTDTTYTIVAGGTGKELRLFDRGGSGSAELTIRHSKSRFTPVSGGEYRAPFAAPTGWFFYRAFDGFVFEAEAPFPSNHTPINLNRKQLTSFATLSANPIAIPNELTIDLDNLHFDIEETSETLSGSNRITFIEEPLYADGALEGFTTFAMRLDATFDWIQAELSIDLSEGSMNHLPSPFPFADVIGNGDTAVFGATTVVGDYSTRESPLVLSGFVETETEFYVGWSDSQHLNGQGDIGMITLTDDANGTLSYTARHANGTYSEKLTITDGQIIPEPPSGILLLICATALALRSRT